MGNDKGMDIWFYKTYWTTKRMSKCYMATDIPQFRLSMGDVPSTMVSKWNEKGKTGAGSRLELRVPESRTNR